MLWIFMSILCSIRPYLEKNSECFKQAQENKELKKPLKLTCCAPGDPIANAPLCVCVPVCMCVFYTLPPVGFFRLHDVCDIHEMFGSAIFCCEYY